MSHPSPLAAAGDLLRQARDTALPPLTDAFAQALGRVDDVLFERAEPVGSTQAAFLQAMRELRRRREEIIERFGNALQQIWRCLEAREPISAEQALMHNHAAGLSLATEQELESRLAARNLALVLARDCKPVLMRLQQRLASLIRMDLDSACNPIGAEHMGVAVHVAFGSCELALDVRLVVIKLCERELLPQVPRLYEAVDTWLLHAGVPLRLPVDVGPAASSPACSEDSGNPPAPVQTVLPARDGRVSQDEQTHTSADVHTEPHMGPHTEPPSESDAPCDIPQADLQPLLMQILPAGLQTWDALPEHDAEPYFSSDAQVLSQPQMLWVLSRLQSDGGSGERVCLLLEDGGLSLAGRIKRLVLHTITQAGPETSALQWAPTDEDAIDWVGRLFEGVQEEQRLEERTRQWVSRLVVPFVKVALLDRSLFLQSTHPARRLLTALLQACAGNHGQMAAERTVLSQVEEVVERLVAGFDQNLEIFLTLGDEFCAFLEQHRRHIEMVERRVAEIQRRQQRLEAVQTRVNDELDQRTQGHDLPAVIDDFLRQAWAQHLGVLLLCQEPDTAAVNAALALADGLLEELAQAKRGIIGKPWLQAWRPGLQQILAGTGMGQEAVHVAIDALHDSLQAMALPPPPLPSDVPLPLSVLPVPALATDTPLPLPAVSVLPQMHVPESLPQAHPSTSAATDTGAPVWDPTQAEHFRQMPIGTRMDFIGKDNKVEVGQLSWISPISSRLLFVNAQGVRFCVASPEELVTMVRMGRLRRHVDQAMAGLTLHGVHAWCAPSMADTGA